MREPRDPVARRRSAVCWLSDEDLRPTTRCDHIVQDGLEMGWAMGIASPFGGPDAVLSLRAILGSGNDGGVITLAIAEG